MSTDFPPIDNIMVERSPVGSLETLSRMPFCSRCVILHSNKAQSPCSACVLSEWLCRVTNLWALVFVCGSFEPELKLFTLSRPHFTPPVLQTPNNTRQEAICPPIDVRKTTVHWILNASFSYLLYLLTMEKVSKVNRTSTSKTKNAGTHKCTGVTYVFMSL